MVTWGFIFLIKLDVVDVGAYQITFVLWDFIRHLDIFRFNKGINKELFKNLKNLFVEGNTIGLKILKFSLKESVFFD